MKTVDIVDKSGLPVAAGGVELAKKGGCVFVDTSDYRAAVDVIRAKVLAGEMTIIDAREQLREANKLITSSYVSRPAEA